jgi:hypothetical protein
VFTASTNVVDLATAQSICGGIAAGAHLLTFKAGRVLGYNASSTS